MPSFAYVTVDIIDRRMDVALPSTVPLTELMPTLLRAGGADLASDGLAHGGWCLRRAGGAALGADQTLDDLGVRDGEVLSFCHVDLEWPEPVVDDIAVAIADEPAMRARSNDPRRLVTGVAALVLAALGSVSGLASGLPSGGLLAGLLACVLIGAAMLRSTRAPADAPVLAAIGVMCAATSAAMVAGPGPRALAFAGLAAVICAAALLVPTGLHRGVPVVAGATGIGAVLAAATWRFNGAAGAGAVALGFAVLCALVAPSAAVRAGGLARIERAGADGSTDLGQSASRTSEVLHGLGWAAMVAAAAGGLGLAHRTGWVDWLVLSVSALALGLRARSHRPPLRRALLLAAVSAMAPATAIASFRGVGGVALTAGLLLASLMLALSGEGGSSPYLDRMAEVAELVAVAAVVPAVCLILGLFGQAG